MEEWKEENEEVFMVPMTNRLRVALFAVTVCAIGERNGLEMPGYPDEFLDIIEAWQDKIAKMMQDKDKSATPGDFYEPSR